MPSPTLNSTKSPPPNPTTSDTTTPNTTISNPPDTTSAPDVDAEIEEMKKRIAELEAEENQIQQLTTDQPTSSPEIDSRSIYVGNVDYSSTPSDLQTLFSACGTVNRVTILCDKHTGHPKGFAYVEFASVEAIQNALLLDGTEFKGRNIKVTEKRTNVPAFQRGRGRGRGRGTFRSRGTPLSRGQRFANKKGIYAPY